MNVEDDELTPEEELRELLETLIDAFGLDAEVVLTESDGVLCGSVEGPGAEALVGPDGTIIEAVQHLAQRPMPAAERRFLHEYLRERGDVETHSEGDEPRRRLVVSPAG